MSLHYFTPFERWAHRQPDTVPCPTRKLVIRPKCAALPLVFRASNLLVTCMSAALFLLGIYVLTLGIPIFLLVVLTGFDLAHLFAQLGQLSEHYLAADDMARAAFGKGLVLSLFGIATLIAIWRLPAFLARLDGRLLDVEP